ncbi:hypothetical protein ACFUCT_20055 [Streptomyces parvus]|uniref:hypothetical protein n=1 Tax=Streptomyces TaxID=1883 RepID=UPI000C27D412|nr:hypothetical protein [Streptomyces sp. CB02613]PJN31115.1 hypothetical protein CG717_15080 [Streptomyces sp. CB02613]
MNAPRPRPRPWYRTASRRRLLRRPRLPGYRGARALCATLVAAATIAALVWLWYGSPYPQSDPDRIAVRLKDQAQRAYDEAALPGRPEVELGRVETGACYYRGLRGLAHIDEGRPDVRSFDLDWQVTAVPEDVARSGLQRMRARLEREGWTFVDTGVDRPGFRFRNPAGEDDVQQVEHVDARWYRETGTYSVSVYAGCGKLPDGFDKYTWPERDWVPEAVTGAPVTPPAARPATPH